MCRRRRSGRSGKVTEAAVNHWGGSRYRWRRRGEKPDPKVVAEEKKRQERDMVAAKAYTLAGQYVGWFGIVRKATRGEAGQRTELLVQHCYSDGLSDLHIQVVSSTAAGIFGRC